MTRSFLYVPANSTHMVESAMKVAADALILDLEDSVPVKEKESARMLAKTALHRFDRSTKEVGIRINSLSTSDWLADLSEIFGNVDAMEAKPDFVVLPKVHTSLDVSCLDRCIEYFERKNSLNTQVKIIATIEDTLGFENLYEIASTGGRLSGLVFGRADYIADLSCNEAGLILPRSSIPVAATAFHLLAIDSSYLKVKDLDGMKKDAMDGKNLGYKAKTAIHPRQVEIINDVFSYSEEEKEWAKSVLKMYDQTTEKGAGVAVLDGKLVDEAVIKHARSILQEI